MQPQYCVYTGPECLYESNKCIEDLARQITENEGIALQANEALKEMLSNGFLVTQNWPKQKVWYKKGELKEDLETRMEDYKDQGYKDMGR